MHVRLAWRNVWRNPRRTAVILTAVVIGVWAMITLGSIMRGMAEGMVDNAIASLTGHIQVHAEGYRSDPVIQHTMARPGPVRKALDAVLPDGARWTGRVRVNAVVNNARHTAGVTLVGIDPEAEARVSFLGPDAVADGRYLKPDDRNGILVGQELLEDFETRIGHKLVAMSQGADGEIASRAFRIIGVFDAELGGTEKRFVFVNRPAAQEMLGLGDGISEISIDLPDKAAVDSVAADLASALPPGHQVHTWREILSALAGYLEMFDTFMYIWYLVIFIAMGFGIVNTLLMAVFERMREFGVLKALGMKPLWIVRGVLTESLLLLLFGALAGNALAAVTVHALSFTGIDLTAFAAGTEFTGISRVIFPAMRSGDLVMANLVVLVLGLAISLYPAVKAARITPVEAMTHH